MGSGVRSLLFGSRREVRFSTVLKIDDAVRLLADNVETSRWGQMFTPHIYGRVSKDSVYLERVTPFFTNSWRPVFEGGFEGSIGGAVLAGTFGVSKATERSIMFGVGFCLLWSVGAGCSVLTTPQPELPVWFSFAGLGMAGLLVATSRVAAAASSSDIVWLTEQLQGILGAQAS